MHWCRPIYSQFDIFLILQWKFSIVNLQTNMLMENSLDNFGYWKFEKMPVAILHLDLVRIDPFLRKWSNALDIDMVTTYRTWKEGKWTSLDS